MATRSDVLSTLVAVFSAAPTASLLDRFIAQVENGQSLTELVEELVNTEEFRSLTYYSGSEEASFRAFLRPLIPSHLRDSLLEVGVQELLALSEQHGFSQAQVINSAVEFLRHVSEVDPVWGEVKSYFNDSVALAETFSSTAQEGAFTLFELRDVIYSRSVDAESQITITEAQTSYIGTEVEDVFSAALQNDQALINAKILDGGDGYDTVTARVTGKPVSFSSDSIEQIILSESDGQGIHLLGTDLAVDTNQIKLSSSGSITVQQLAANSGSTQLYAEGVSGQDGKDSIEVMFSDEATTQKLGFKTESSDSVLVIRLLDFDSPVGELLTNPYSGVQFLFNGQEVTLAGDRPFDNSDDIISELESMIAEQGLSDQLQVRQGSTFKGYNSDDGKMHSAKEILLTSTSGLIESPQWFAPFPNFGMNGYTQLTVAELKGVSEANLSLSHIGSGSQERVDVLVGTEANDLGVQGIEQLNLTITGDNWLETMASTNDALKTIVAERDSSWEEANLNLSTLQDVSGFNAKSLTSVVLTAQLTDISQTKYALEDTVFTYQLSAGDDALIIDVTDEALQADSNLNWLVDTGAGTDVVKVVSDFAGTLTITSVNGQAFDQGSLYLSGLMADQIELDFSAYLTTYQEEGSDQVALASSYTALETNEQNEITSNSIVSFDVDGKVYDALTETNLMEALNGLADVGSITDQSLDASMTEANLKSQSTGYYDEPNREYLLMIENSDTNEFKAFHLVADVGESDFSRATLIGAYDFGDMSVTEIFA